MLSITAKDFNTTLTTVEKTAAQRKVIMEALGDALRKSRASGEPVCSITITSLKIDSLTEEMKNELEESGFAIKKYQPYVGVSEYLKIFIPKQ